MPQSLLARLTVNPECYRVSLSTVKTLGFELEGRAIGESGGPQLILWVPSEWFDATSFREGHGPYFESKLDWKQGK